MVWYGKIKRKNINKIETWEIMKLENIKKIGSIGNVKDM